jgi:hypothetical protein
MYITVRVASHPLRLAMQIVVGCLFVQEIFYTLGPYLGCTISLSEGQQCTSASEMAKQCRQRRSSISAGDIQSTAYDMVVQRI